jgi:hypothetical protein
MLQTEHDLPSQVRSICFDITIKHASTSYLVANAAPAADASKAHAACEGEKYTA